MDSAMANALAGPGRPTRADAPRRCDRGFIAHIVAGPKERAITAAIIGLGQAIGMSVIAEGVGTHEQLALVRQLGADEIQGFCFSQPLPAGECEPFLSRSCRSQDERLAQDRCAIIVMTASRSAAQDEDDATSGRLLRYRRATRPGSCSALTAVSRLPPAWHSRRGSRRRAGAGRDSHLVRPRMPSPSRAGGGPPGPPPPPGGGGGAGGGGRRGPPARPGVARQARGPRALQAHDRRTLRSP
jgi:hypothetical protein